MRDTSLDQILAKVDSFPTMPNTPNLEMVVVYLDRSLCKAEKINGKASENPAELRSKPIDSPGIQLDQFGTISGKVAR